MCETYNLIFLDSDEINKVYNSKTLLMDAYDNKLGIFDERKLPNAIFSIDKECLGEKVLLIYGSEDNRFITNRAYDLIFSFKSN